MLKALGLIIHLEFGFLPFVDERNAKKRFVSIILLASHYRASHTLCNFLNPCLH